MNPRRLYRCRHDRPLAGVASGMAEYLDLDPTVVRILWILSAFLGGFTILLYVILAFVMPLEPAGLNASAVDPAATADGAEASTTNAWTTPVPVRDAHQHRQRGAGRLGLAVGIVLVVFGGIALVGSVLPGWFAGLALGPAFVVALGIALVAVAIRRPTATS
ncbi:MAG: PspC domain-containing protein [Candidatus Limnocylindrales bacterium]